MQNNILSARSGTREWKKKHIAIFEKPNWWYTLQTGLSLFVVILKLSFFFLFSIFQTESNTLSFKFKMTKESWTLAMMKPLIFKIFLFYGKWDANYYNIIQ